MVWERSGTLAPQYPTSTQLPLTVSWDTDHVTQPYPPVPDSFLGPIQLIEYSPSAYPLGSVIECCSTPKKDKKKDLLVHFMYLQLSCVLISVVCVLLHVIFTHSFFSSQKSIFTFLWENQKQRRPQTKKVETSTTNFYPPIFTHHFDQHAFI